MEELGFNKIIWSVAGGKGGTGKSIITANIGIGLSILGFRVILIDGDLGGPNLHNYLNIKKPTYTLNDFISNKRGEGGFGLCIYRGQINAQVFLMP